MVIIAGNGKNGIIVPNSHEAFLWAIDLDKLLSPDRLSEARQFAATISTNRSAFQSRKINRPRPYLPLFLFQAEPISGGGDE